MSITRREEGRGEREEVRKSSQVRTGEFELCYTIDLHIPDDVTCR